LGYTGVAEAAGDPLIRRFIRDCYMEEITATLPPVPGMDLTGYKDTLIKRFSNLNIADTVLRLASDGSKKIPNAILNPLAETVRAGGDDSRLKHTAILFALAAWARFLTGTGEGGEVIPLEDPAAAELSALAKNARQDPAAFLRAARTPGLADGEFGVLAGEFAKQLEKIYMRGIRAALEELIR
jgi:mannitol 2-dehydrogenase